MPNVDGLPPGQVIELYSYDHDLSAFMAIGTGTVSADGLLVRSDPGVGILKAGWHCGGNPNSTGAVENVHVRLAKHPVVVCQNQPFTFNATGGPGPGNFQWTAPNSSKTENVSGSGSSNPSSFTVTFNATGVATITVKYTCSTTGKSAQDSSTVEILPPTQTSPGDKKQRFPFGPELTDAEWALVQSHPLAALDMNDARNRAEAETISRFGTHRDGTISNAFLHSAWNYLAAKAIGASLAKDFTDAHENIFGNPCIDTTTGASKYMDLNNNKAGLDMATNPLTSGLSETSALNRLEQMARNGQLFNVR